MLPTVLAKNIALGFFGDNFFILLCWKMIGGRKKSLYLCKTKETVPPEWYTEQQQVPYTSDTPRFFFFV